MSDPDTIENPRVDPAPVEDDRPDADIQDEATIKIADLETARDKLFAERNAIYQKAASDIAPITQQIANINAQLVAEQAKLPKVFVHPESPPHSEDAEMQKQRNLRGVADTPENRLAALEAKVFADAPSSEQPNDGSAGD